MHGGPDKYWRECQMGAPLSKAVRHRVSRDSLRIIVFGFVCMLRGLTPHMLMYGEATGSTHGVMS